MPDWVRCRDDTTGHEVDVHAQSLRPGLTPIPGYPPNSGPGAIPRPAKHHVDKAGKPARPRTAKQIDPPPPEAATPEPDKELPS